MSARFRLLAIVTAMMIAFSISGIAIAQSDFPDPDSPVQDRTPTPEDEEEDEEDPTPTEEDTPTEEPDETPTEEPEDTATPEPEDTATEEPEETPTEAAEETPAEDAEATPPGGGRPVAAGEDLPLAAMTLDDTTISGEYQLFFERYTTPEEMSDSVVNLVTVEELLATGLIAQYTSYYFNEDGNSIRTYVLAFETIQGVRGGFNLVEDEERLVPNGALTDLPPLEGVGEAPGEITTGQIEEGDGTQTGTYDVTFRMDRYLVGAAMETYDGSEPDTDLVDSMAADLAERIDLILSGEMPDGIDYALPGQVIELGGDVLIEGYQTGQEAFLITDPDDVPEGYLSGYYRAATFSRNIQTVLPFVTVGVSTFESADDVEAALLDLDELTPLFPDIEELDGVEVDTADDVQAVSYSSPDGEGEPDSVRVFVQVEAKLLVIDVQGLDSVDDAEDAAVEYAQAQVNCVLDGDCDDPGVIEFE